MAYWLMKSEPGSWSWDDQVKDGVGRVGRRAQLPGSQQHEGHEDRRQGLLLPLGQGEAGGRHLRGGEGVLPRPTDASGRFGMVDIKALRPFAQPVSLAEIKAEPSLSELALIRQSRLSVMPIAAAEWRTICKMGKTKP